jgi:hypothetical protein
MAPLAPRARGAKGARSTASRCYPFKGGPGPGERGKQRQFPGSTEDTVVVSHCTKRAATAKTVRHMASGVNWFVRNLVGMGLAVAWLTKPLNIQRTMVAFVMVAVQFLLWGRPAASLALPRLSHFPSQDRLMEGLPRRAVFLFRSVPLVAHAFVPSIDPCVVARLASREIPGGGSPPLLHIELGDRFGGLAFLARLVRDLGLRHSIA